MQRVDALGSTAANQLEALETKVTSLSADIEAEVSSRRSFAETHRRSMETSSSELKQELADFKSSADASMAKLTEDFGQQASFQTKAIENFEQRMGTQLEERSKNLGESTVAKDKLATLLFDAAATLADPEPTAAANA